MRVWKNERGLTLTELMAAVVIMGIVAVPLTSLGTTILHWHQEDQQLNEAVLLAERVMLAAKLEVERTGELSEEQQKGNEGDMKWEFAMPVKDFQYNEELVPGVKQLTVTISYPDPLDREKMSNYQLTAVARVRGQRQI